jgi:hypothetical protein
MRTVATTLVSVVGAIGTMGAVTATGVLSSGCIRKSAPPAATTSVQLDPEILAKEGEVMRLALMDPAALKLVDSPAALHTDDSFELLKTTHENLIKSDALIPSPVNKDASLSKPLFSALNLAGSYGKDVRKGEAGWYRHDAFEIRGDLSKAFIAGKRATVALPFTLSAESSLHVARWFATEDEAKAASGAALAFDLGDLPLDGKKAQDLKPGEYFGIPMTTNLILNINGAFLQRAVSWQKETVLLKFLQDSLRGNLSAVAEGQLLGQGRFHLHILKVDANRVRVKVTTHQSMEAKASAGVRLSASNRYVFFPGTRYQKLKGLKAVKEFRKPTRLLDLARKSRDVRDLVANELLAGFEYVDRASAERDLGLDAAPASAARLVKGASDAVDEFVEAADALNEGIDELNKRTTVRINKEIGEINTKFFDPIQPFVDKTIDFSAAVDLSGAFATGVRLVADYVVDLSTEEGRAAYERMVTGRVVMQASEGVLSKWKLKGAALSDFTAVDELSDRDALKPEGERRAVRQSQVINTFARGDVGLTFRILDASRGFVERWKENDVAIGGDGADLRHKLRTWEFENSLNVVGVDSESKSSGVLYPTDDKKRAIGYGNYFYTWKRRYPPQHATPVRDSLTQATTVLGPTAILLGLADIYDGEVPGGTHVDISVTYLPGALESFFDPTTSEEAHWKAFSRALGGWNQSVDNPATLQRNILVNPLAPALSSLGAKYCKALPWDVGPTWCRAFQNRFLDAWKKAAVAKRADGQPDFEKRLQFLEAHFDFGFLANKMGGDLISRYFNELMYEKHGAAWLPFVVLRVDFENSTEDSGVANPDFAFGADPAGEVVEALSESLR